VAQPDAGSHRPTRTGGAGEGGTARATRATGLVGLVVLGEAQVDTDDHVLAVGQADNSSKEKRHCPKPTFHLHTLRVTGRACADRISGPFPPLCPAGAATATRICVRAPGFAVSTA